MAFNKGRGILRYSVIEAPHAIRYIPARRPRPKEMRRPYVESQIFRQAQLSYS
jgi:hypothetical protein